jgi:hypothetical protein
VSVLVHYGDEPAGPVPARHDRAMLEVARERRSIRASGGVARQVNALVIVQNLFAIGEMEIIPRHHGTSPVCINYQRCYPII